MLATKQHHRQHDLQTNHGEGEALGCIGTSAAQLHRRAEFPRVAGTQWHAEHELQIVGTQRVHKSDLVEQAHRVADPENAHDQLDAARDQHGGVKADENHRAEIVGQVPHDVARNLDVGFGACSPHNTSSK